MPHVPFAKSPTAVRRSTQGHPARSNSVPRWRTHTKLFSFAPSPRNTRFSRKPNACSINLSTVYVAALKWIEQALALRLYRVLAEGA
jgi:hypothetical protein